MCSKSLLVNPTLTPAIEAWVSSSPASSFCLCFPLCGFAVCVNQMEKARRPQVPAFGEWNYCYHHYGEPPAAESYYDPEPEPEACSDVWFRYSPPRKPTPRKTRRPESDAREKGSRRSARGSEDAGLAQATTKGRGAAASQVRPVDEDLYQVPPPEFISRRPRRKRRSLLMGCLGLNSCVA